MNAVANPKEIRALAGFSFSGLFAAYVWLYDSNTFSRYLIGSPSLWWDNGMILKAEAAKAESDKGLHGRVFLSIGGDESEELSSFKNLTTTLKTHAYPNLQLETHIFEGENHLWVRGDIQPGPEIPLREATAKTVMSCATLLCAD
jgi:hypothetical protein